jgi:uncharacterized protein YecT (DUF1311 family)
MSQYTRNQLLIALVTILSVTTLHAQDSKQAGKIDTELKQCLEKKENETTAGMCNCTYKALEQWDQSLNATYKLLLSKLKPEARSKMIEAQRQWIKFKESELQLISATYGTADGTMWRVIKANKILDVTRDRAVDLDVLLNVLEEF